jgi:hypothetical protein
MIDMESASSTDAQRIADESYEWYRRHAIRARRLSRTVDCLQIVLAALIPLGAAALPGNTLLPAAIGAVLAMLAGVRGIFHWQENYVRFSQARESVERERRNYAFEISPYDLAKDRAGTLVARVTDIESSEMGAWSTLLAKSAPEAHPSV